MCRLFNVTVNTRIYVAIAATAKHYIIGSKGNARNADLPV